jgi:hypothetical protein
VEDTEAAKLEAPQSKYSSLEKTYEDDVKAAGKCLFRLERFIGSASDFWFYAGFPDYVTFKVFFNYLSPAYNSLIYYGSTTGVISSANQKKHGRQRSTSPEQELFMDQQHFLPTITITQPKGCLVSRQMDTQVLYHHCMLVRASDKKITNDCGILGFLRQEIRLW